MRLIAHIMLVVFAVVAISGRGAAQPIVFHAHDHHHSDAHAQEAIDGHHYRMGVIVTVADTCTQVSCDAPESNQFEAHLHISCCGAYAALLPNECGVQLLTESAVDHSIGRASLALGELRYPLLRPPRQLA